MRRTAFVLVLLAVTAAPLRAESPRAEPVTVPFEMLQKGRLSSGHMAVQVKVNGQGPYRLIFDTGAPMILLSNKVAKEAGLLGAGGKRPAARGAFALPGQVTVGKLELGPLAAEDLAAVVMDHPTVKAIAEAFGPIDGIVGFPFFARYRTAIDYQAKRLTFTPNGYQPADAIQSLMNMLTTPRNRQDPAAARVLAPAAQWGMRVTKDADDEVPGVTVVEVFAGGAAAKAGLKAGDRLLTLDGRWIDSVADCYQAAEAVQPGQAAELVLRRGSREVKLTVAPAMGM
jgi:hypothetical protein